MVLAIIDWAPVIAALGGVGGLAAVLRVVSERSGHRGDLAVSLNTTARDWIEYIDDKFGEVSKELEKERKDRVIRETARILLIREHRRWDEQLMRDYKEATGKSATAPPRFWLIEDDYPHGY